MDTPKIQKFSNTVEFQLELAIEELLSEAYHEEKYEGILEIKWSFDKSKKESKLNVSSKHVLIVPKKKQENTVYFQITQGKGVKRL